MEETSSAEEPGPGAEGNGDNGSDEEDGPTTTTEEPATLITVMLRQMKVHLWKVIHKKMNAAMVSGESEDENLGQNDGTV